MGDDVWAPVKFRDPVGFIKADDFFAGIDNPQTNSWVHRPQSIKYLESDNYVNSNLRPTCSHGRIFRFDDDSLLLIQFLRPKVWRIRFHEVNKSPDDFTDFNTRTIVQDTTTKLIDILDQAEDRKWSVQLQDSSRYLILKSVVNDGKDAGLKLWIQKNPFQITATSPVKQLKPFLTLPVDDVPINLVNGLANDAVNGYEKAGEAVIWQTKVRGFRYGYGAVVLSIQKTPTAKYVGFGEQGGKRFAKDKTFMNYFNFDNMRYRNIYGKGPEWDAEPLYHSDPYFIEVNGLPSFQSSVGTFIDNYSHVCVDLGITDWSLLRVGTRFNAFQALFFAGDNVQHLIQSFTSIVGRPRLKPRFVLGYHQGCYGYETREQVLEAVNGYRKYDYPMDGMHIDVDIQDQYRTFSVDQQAFHQPAEMFRILKDQGIKCSTNITPVISSRPADWYGTLNEALKKGYFVADERNLDPSVDVPDHVRYICYYDGNKRALNPSNKGAGRPGFGDGYEFNDTFNKGVPFHGGVYYGGDRGTPGHYADLNREDVRDWWGQQYKYLLDQGLEFVWQDMTSPCMADIYGDFKSWPFRLMLSSDAYSGENGRNNDKKMAIEIWSLYSYNLHKATYKGLNNLRGDKRNFIIGRGSFTGAHRYAGLWTGDNSSTWQFFNISVAQVISLGLSGVTIAGADVGGFEPPDGMDKEQGQGFCGPELFIRWNLAYSLLPWYRNHYTRKGPKRFQEPWKYQEYYENPFFGPIADSEKPIYQSVNPICRYYIRLRYTLMQLMYDAMFENILNGLPIARAMIITDPVDGSLYAENTWYTRSQYCVRNDLLVCPVLLEKRPVRKLYLPAPDNWYAFNLRAFDYKTLGVPLGKRVGGGTYINYNAAIEPCAGNDAQLPYVLPIYVRAGAIIPQIEPRLFVPDRTDSKQAQLPANPITINVYPGKDQVYDMYLDDGVSRSSAPENTYLGSDDHGLLNSKLKDKMRDAFGDENAKSQFTHFKIEQITTHDHSTTSHKRSLTIKAFWANYSWDLLKRDIGDVFTVVLWHDPETTNVGNAKVTIAGVPDGGYTSRLDNQAHATVLQVPVQVPGDTKEGLTIELDYQKPN